MTREPIHETYSITEEHCPTCNTTHGEFIASDTGRNDDEGRIVWSLKCWDCGYEYEAAGIVEEQHGLEP